MNPINSLRPAGTGESYTASSQDSAAQISVLRIVNAVLRRRAIVVMAPFTVAIVAATIRIVMPRRYVTAASFAPQLLGQSGALQGLAAQFGIGMQQSSDPTQQPMFYEKLSRTPELLRRVVETTFPLRRGGRVEDRDLLDVFDVRGSTRSIREEKAIEYLRNQITATTDPVTGVIRLEISLRDAQLSLAVMQRLLAAINDFNAAYRRDQAEAELQYTAERDAAARADLRRAEDSLADFLARNRQYENDPRLSSEHDRLAREVGIRQDLFTSLAQHLQQSALDAARTTPVIHIIEHPVLPAEPAPRHLVLIGIVAGFCGLLLSVLFVLLPELIAASGAEDPHAYEIYLQLRNTTAADIRRLRLPWQNRARKVS